MLEHLDDPLPLRPSTPQQRQAVLMRGQLLRQRRRRRAKVIILQVVAVAAVVAGVLAWAPPPRTAAPIFPAASVSPSPVVEATATVGPGRGTAVFLGADSVVRVTFTLPAGWQAEEGGISKSNSDPIFGYVFYDVANVYADGCQWKLVSPPPGPTVDDLVAAYRKVPGIEGAARDVTVDGYQGKQIQHTVPSYKEDDCRDGRYGLIYEDNNLVSDDAPSLWAQTPGQQNKVTILDVDGTRLVIAAGNPPNISARDRANLDGILNSIEIG